MRCRAWACKMGDRVATLAWNGYRHLELYYAVSGSGAVLHTINPRLHPEQIAYIVNHAEDQYLFFDLTFLPLIEAVAAHCKTVKGFVLMADRDRMPQETTIPNLLCYEDLIASSSDDYEWPLFDENSAASLCYTSGTTGNPKGALYSHRSTVLHAYASAMPNALNVSAADTVLPVVPMFHVNAWGLPYSVLLSGAKMVFPGAALDGKSLYELFESEGVTFSAGVPTVWLGLVNYVAAEQSEVLHLPPHRDRRLGLPAGDDGHADRQARRAGDPRLGHDRNVAARHRRRPAGQAPGAAEGRAAQDPAEAGPCHLRRRHEDRRRRRARNCRGTAAPTATCWSRGRGSSRSYFKNEGGDVLQDGWFPTGDVATIDADGYMQITDRSKDVIKSGGEWIGTIDLENIAMAHPAVLQAACIGIAHPKWDERPLLLVVKRPGQEVTREELLGFFEGKIAKLWMPDDVVFIDALADGRAPARSRRTSCASSSASTSCRRA